jgi:hypothetical protein
MEGRDQNVKLSVRKAENNSSISTLLSAQFYSKIKFVLFFLPNY